MRFVDSIFALALFGLWVFCLIDVIMTPRAACRRLPKPAWLVLVFLLSWIGAALWLAAGRPRRTASALAVVDPLPDKPGVRAHRGVECR